jgi:hypothetical protein
MLKLISQVLLLIIIHFFKGKYIFPLLQVRVNIDDSSDFLKVKGAYLHNFLLKLLIFGSYFRLIVIYFVYSKLLLSFSLMILFTSLYAIKTLIAIKNIKKVACMIHSIFSFIAFFQKIFCIKPLITIKINLHQSKAGIGNRLKTHKFILMIAQIIKIKITQFVTDFVIKSTTQIGPEI